MLGLPALAKVIALAALTVRGPSLASETRPSRISGGERVGECGWPSVVWMKGCTGTLVDPQHVIYAAHCSAPDEVFFGEDGSGSDGHWEDVQRCWSFPGGGPGGGDDFAICRLQQAQPDIQIVPPLMGCETDILRPGQEVTLVGFGLTPQGDFSIKHAVTTTINDLTDSGELSIGGDGKDSCNGDSGGPVFVQLPDNAGWRVFGITSHGSFDCQSGGFYALVHRGMEWFEETSGRDLSPCHGEDGAWAPDPRCRAAPLAPMTGEAYRPLCDGGGPVSGLLATCGEPFSEPPDLDPPEVSIEDPREGDEFATEASNGQLSVAVTVTAVDVGWGVERVELEINGAPLDEADFVEPFEFDVSLGPGVFELAAIAHDFAGNVAYSDAVSIGIKEGTPSTPGADGTEDQAGGCNVDRHRPTGSLAFAALILAGLRRRRHSS